jgi:ferredoxin
LGYNVNSEAQNQILFKRAKSKVTKILAYIKEQKGNIKPNLLQQVDNRTNDLNRNFRETVMESDNKFYVDENCTSCGICEQVCPVNNIKIIEGKPEWLHQCQQCLACINYCPEEAIQYGNKTLTTGRYYHPEVDNKAISLQQQIK